MVQHRRHGKPQSSRPRRARHPQSYRIACSGCGKEVITPVPPPEGRKLLCTECFGKKEER